MRTPTCTAPRGPHCVAPKQLGDGVPHCPDGLDEGPGTCGEPDRLCSPACAVSSTSIPHP